MSANSIGAIGSEDDLITRLKKKNPAVRQYGTVKEGAFVAFKLDDFSKSGTVPGYSDVSIHTQNA